VWAQQGGDIDGSRANAFQPGRHVYFGGSVSLSGDGSTVAIGAECHSSNGHCNGHMSIYNFDGTAWVQKGADIDGEASLDRAGRVSLSSNGNIAAVGAYTHDGNGADSGQVRIYSFDGNAWVQQGADIDGEAAHDYSGTSVSLSSDGSTVAIGASFLKRRRCLTT
jgi:hypothetical protein